MKVANIISYFLLAGVAAASFWETTRLLRRYPGRALRSYRLALAGFLGSAIFGIIGNYILQEMLFLQGSPGSAHVSAAWVFGLLVLPLNILALDAFAASFRAWAGKRYAPAWRIAYFVLQPIVEVMIRSPSGLSTLIKAGREYGILLIFLDSYKSRTGDHLAESRVWDTIKMGR